MEYIRIGLTCFLLQCSIIFSGLTSSAAISAQTVRQVTGSVFSKSDNSAVTGATVVVEGTNIAAVTDIQGNFILNNVPSNAKRLKISFIGMKEVSAPIMTHIRIMMEDNASQLDEVMVVAYGTAKKNTFTGSASVVNTDKLDLRPVTDVSSALLASASGVSVTTSSGMPGSSSSILIRGVGSFSASSSPLIIMDGAPYEEDLSSINPSDIENMTVLKDAASTALYGARAANGVLLITTKKGKKGKTKINFKFNQGITARQSSDYKKLGVSNYCEIYWENLYNKYKKDRLSQADAATSASKNLMTTLEYNPFTNVASDEVVGTDGKFNSVAKMAWGDDTNWEDAIERLGNRTDAGVSVNGGDNNTDYYISAGLVNEKGYIVGSSFKRYTAMANVNSKINNWFKIGMNLSANANETEGVQNETRNTYSNPFLFTRYIGPIYPIHLHDASTGAYILDPNGNKIYDFGTGYDVGPYTSPNRSYASPSNPVIELQDRDNGYTNRDINAKGYAEFKFLRDFTFTVNANVNSNTYLATYSDKVYAEKANTGVASRTNTFTTTSNFNELLEYKKSIKNNHIDALLGHENYKYVYNYLNASMKGEIMTGNSELINYTDVNSTPISYTNKYRTEGYFFRGTYDFDNVYYGSLSFRRDGSSRFYKNSRWGNFWSAGAGWSINREKFMEDINWIDNLKLRLSYGEVGNDNVGSYYPWLASYTSSNNLSEAGYVQSNLGNKNLQWEVSHNFDLALEFGFLNRFSGSIEYFNRKSTNLLFSVPLSPSTGFDSQDQNTGSMYNSGIEIQLTSHILKMKDWKWDVDVNGTFLKNKITYLPVDAFIDNDVFKIEEGHSRYEFYLKQWRGVDPETGDCIYEPAEGATQLVTVNGKQYTTSLSEAAYGYSGSGIPTFTGGFTTTIGYKNLSFTTTFYYQLGGKLYDTTYQNLMTPNQRSYNNLSTDILKRWQKSGDITNVPRLSDGSDATDLIGQYSTRWLVSSNMLEISTAILSYDIPKKWLRNYGIGGLKVYVSGENLLTFAARKGLFPRQYVSGYSNNGDTYAPARVFTAGINLNF